MNRNIKTWLNMCLILVVGSIVGTLLLTLVFCIPVDRAFQHYNDTGLEMILSREGWHKYLVDYDASTLDNNTEWAMLKVAATPLPKSIGDNVFRCAMRGYTLNTEWNHGMRFINYEWNGEWYSCDSYERYWHGYVVFLKPLLTLFSYTDIIFLNMALQFGLILFLMHILTKKKCKNLQIIFAFFWIISMQVIIMFSMDYSVCFYLYMLGAITMLLWKKAREHYIYTFLVLGMLTSYMDFLTWPLVTLVIPLIVFLYVEQGKNMLTSLMASISWGIGYVGLWMGKWGIGSLILMDNILEDAIERFLMRSSMKVVEGEVKTSFWETIKINFSVFSNKGYLALLIGMLLVIILLQLYRWHKGGSFKKGKFYNIIILLILPMGWYLVTSNHATEHYWMTWRNAALAVMIVFAAILMSYKEENRET